MKSISQDQKIDFLILGFQILKCYKVKTIFAETGNCVNDKIFVDVEYKVSIQDLGELVRIRWYKENDNRWWTFTNEPGWVS